GVAPGPPSAAADIVAVFGICAPFTAPGATVAFQEIIQGTPTATEILLMLISVPTVPFDGDPHPAKLKVSTADISASIVSDKVIPVPVPAPVLLMVTVNCTTWFGDTML